MTAIYNIYEWMTAHYSCVGGARCATNGAIKASKRERRRQRKRHSVDVCVRCLCVFAKWEAKQ